MGSRAVSDGAIVSNADRVDPWRSDPCVVSLPITVTVSTVGRQGSRSTAATGAKLSGRSGSKWELVAGRPATELPIHLDEAV
jgi:hypothetical protein